MQRCLINLTFPSTDWSEVFSLISYIDEEAIAIQDVQQAGLDVHATSAGPPAAAQPAPSTASLRGLSRSASVASMADSLGNSENATTSG